ncbi:MAG: PfkB family carbohydrate kinase [Gemmobacter sp.]
MTQIICVGAMLWDIIGRVPGRLRRGADAPGAVERRPGGVALNVALALARAGFRPRMLSAVGRDVEGAALIRHVRRHGLDCSVADRSASATDRYVAVEDAGGLVSAVADTGALAAAGTAILAPLRDGRITQPFEGIAVIDGNLSPAVLCAVATDPALSAADLRVVSASANKAPGLLPLLAHPRATFYLNRAEAEALSGIPGPDADSAARAVVACGAARAVVTDGAAACADADRMTTVRALPRSARPARVTGAGDAFVAAHLAAELRGIGRDGALAAALAAAHDHITQDLRP